MGARPREDQADPRWLDAGSGGSRPTNGLIMPVPPGWPQPPADWVAPPDWVPPAEWPDPAEGMATPWRLPLAGAAAPVGAGRAGSLRARFRHRRTRGGPAATGARGGRARLAVARRGGGHVFRRDLILTFRHLRVWVQYDVALFVGFWACLYALIDENGHTQLAGLLLALSRLRFAVPLRTQRPAKATRPANARRLQPPVPPSSSEAQVAQAPDA